MKAIFLTVFIVVQANFIIMKLQHQILWNWFWVLSPCIFLAALAILFIIVIFILGISHLPVGH